jgi:hypothetical protein
MIIHQTKLLQEIQCFNFIIDIHLQPIFHMTNTGLHIFNQRHKMLTELVHFHFSLHFQNATGYNVT